MRKGIILILLTLFVFPVVNCGGGMSFKASDLTDCAEDDLPAVPAFFGEAVEKGKLSKKPGKPYYVAATHFLMKNNSQEAVETFQTLMNKLDPAIRSADGLLGATLTFSMKCGYGRTMTIWKDEASMMKFATSEAHATAVTKTSTIASHFRTTHWKEEDASWPPTWKQSKDKLTEIKVTTYP